MRAKPDQRTVYLKLDGIYLNVGSYGSFTRDQLIKEISDKTKLGELVVEMQMSYIRSFKERVQV